MNVYDFDNTIYDGESTVDFFLFCLRRNPSHIKFLFTVIKSVLKYKLGKMPENELLELAERHIGELTSVCGGLQKSIILFWDKNEKKIKDFYLKQQSAEDVIISASPSFLLNEICLRKNIKYCICSEVDIRARKIIRLCYAEKKADFFADTFPNEEIDNFYTDSKIDLPMMRLAKHSYIVKGNRVREYFPKK